MRKAPSKKRTRAGEARAGEARAGEVKVEASVGAQRPITAQQRGRLARLAEKPDAEIDFSDSPEITEWSGFQRGAFYRPVKKQITLRVDADVIAWFQARKANGYQTAINSALREYITLRQRKRAPKRRGKAA